MSIKQMTKVFSDSSLKPIKKLIMLSLADNANDEGFCYPSIKTICLKTALSKPTVINNLKDLEELKKIISKRRTRKNGTATSKIYVLYPLDNLENIDEDIKEKFNQSKAPLPTHQSKAPLPKRGGQSKAPLPLEPSLTINHNLPEWLDAIAWNEWVAFRKEIKKPLTNLMTKKQIEFLSNHKEYHKSIINSSIMNGWTGLFEIKKGFKQKEVDTSSENNFGYK